MKVLHVTPYFPPDRIGGVGEVARIIHDGLKLRGVRSEVLTSGRDLSKPDVHRIGRTPIRFILRSWQGLKLAKASDVLHVHHGEALLLLLLVRTRRPRPSILLMYHVDVRRREAANGPHVVAGRRYGPRLIRNLLRSAAGLMKVQLDRVAWLLADAVTAETEHVANELSDFTPKRKVNVVPYGIGARPAMSSELDRVELLYVGTSGVRKRTHLLPLILSEVQNSLPLTKLRIVGFTETEEPLLVSEARRLGVLNSIEFAGRFTSDELAPFYRSADVLILPSVYEGLPLVLLEAMREGLVPVASNVSGHPDAIEDGVEGFLVPVDDVDAMAERCVELLTDASRAISMGESARRKIVERFPLDAQLNSYTGLYEQVIQSVRYRRG